MRVAAVQTCARFGQMARVLEEADRLLASAGPLELAVLPEAALTGYLSPSLECDLTPFAEPIGGATTKALSELATKHRCHLLGPLIERDGGRAFNSVLLFDPDGKVVARYRKRHPWYPERWASGSAESPFVARIGGLEVTVAVCFDIRFVEEVASELRRADLLLFPSAWVADEHGVDGREELLSDLARKFEVGIVNANWGVGEPSLRGQGGSMIVDASGRVRTCLGPSADVALAELGREA